MINGRPTKELDVQQIVSLRQHGLNWTQVARVMGVHRNTIVRRREIDAAFRSLTNVARGVPSDEDAMLLSLLDKPLHSETAAERLRKEQIESAVKDRELECSALVTHAILSAVKKRERMIAALPKETRDILHRLQRYQQRGDLAFRLRQAANALDGR